MIHLKSREKMLLPTLCLDWVSGDKGGERDRGTAMRTKPVSPQSQTSGPGYWVSRRDPFSGILVKKEIHTCSRPYIMSLRRGTVSEKGSTGRACPWPLMSTSTLVRAPNVARNNGRQPAQRGAEKDHCRDPDACGLQTGCPAGLGEGTSAG